LVLPPSWIATGLFYGLPLPVQPMKAVSAVILTGGLRPGEVAAAGMMIGVVLLILGITGWIGRLARAVPQSVSAGLQLGLGLLMGVLGLKLTLETPWLGFGSLALLFALTRVPHCPAAPLALAVAMIAGWATGKVGIVPEVTVTPDMPRLVLPSWPEVWRSFEIAVLPQLSLTLTNAVIVTASLSRELFPSTGAIASERRLALSSGLANVLLCPLGAMPMCHGAGGLAAIPLRRAHRPCADYLWGRAARVGGRVRRSRRRVVCAYTDRRGRIAADFRGNGLGDLAALVRRQAVVLVGNRGDGSCHRHCQSRPRSDIGLGCRMDTRSNRAPVDT